MKWEELSAATGDILERCWFATYSDRATQYSVEIGEKLYSTENEVTSETLKEIFEYQKTNPHYNVTFSEETQTISVSGAYDYDEWNGFDNGLTELGKKTELEVGDFLYRATSDDISNFHKETITKLTSKQVTFSSGYTLPTPVLGEMLLSNQPYLVAKDSEYEQSFIFRESSRIVQSFNRQLLVGEFNEVFHLKTVSDSKLRKIIEIIKSTEIQIIDNTKERKVLCKSCGESAHMDYINTYGTSDLYNCTECKVQTQI